MPPPRCWWKACAGPGPNPTRAKLLAGLESIKKFDFGGLEVSYAADDHTGLDFADLSIIGADGKFKR